MKKISLCLSLFVIVACDRGGFKSRSNIGFPNFGVSCDQDSSGTSGLAPIKGVLTPSVPEYRSQSEKVYIAWDPPLKTADGNPLQDEDLWGYHIYSRLQGTSSWQIQDWVYGEVSTHIIQNLSSGCYDFSIAALDGFGAVSNMSCYISKCVVDVD